MTARKVFFARVTGGGLDKAKRGVSRSTCAADPPGDGLASHSEQIVAEQLHYAERLPEGRGPVKGGEAVPQGCGA